MPQPRKPEAAARTTDRGPAHLSSDTPHDLPDRKMAETQALVQAMPCNVSKPLGHGYDNTVSPPQGTTVVAPSPLATGGSKDTVREVRGFAVKASVFVKFHCVPRFGTHSLV